MIAHVFFTPEETAQKYLWLCRLSEGWKIYSCEVNGQKVYGVSYNIRDFLAMVRKRCIKEAMEVGIEDLPKPKKEEVKRVENLEKRYTKKRKVAKKPAEKLNEPRTKPVRDPEHPSSPSKIASD